MAGTEVVKTRPPVIDLDASGNCSILPTQQVPMLAQLSDWMAERHGGDGRVLGVAWYNKMFSSAKTKPTVEELVEIFYRAYVNGTDPMLDECHAHIVIDKYGKRSVVFTVGINGWLSRAASNDDYLSCTAEVICEHDAFEWDAVKEEPAIHRFSKKNRGKVLGAWAKLKRKGKPDWVMNIDRDEFMSLLHGSGRDFLHNKLSMHMTKWIVIRHLLRQAYPRMLRGAMLPEEAGAMTTNQGTVIPVGQLATGPNKDELPKSEMERNELLQEIDDLFTALNITSDDQNERTTMRRKKAELVLKRSLKHVGLGDLFDTDIVVLRDRLRYEKEGTSEPKDAEVVTPEEVKPKAEEELVECTKCKEKKIPPFVAKTQTEKNFPVVCPECRGPEGK